ncbi:chromodomain-helicase-DNA-binding protein 6 isoform X2 [Antennarius striatus]|uniref:chromodomain-helicase-DNA-binding protein 6 isoform X2 n=1 Tax=Antennarius striatus TaxID=241820 RepID=UPI0035B1E6EA
MKIHKKNKQQMLTGLLKHATPQASDAAPSSFVSDQNSNTKTSVPTIPRGQLIVGPKDQLQLVTPVGGTATSNHCIVVDGHASNNSGRTLRHSSSLSEDDDDEGGEGRGKLKKKRKKKDKIEWEKERRDGREKETSTLKKRKKEKEMVTPRRSKELNQSKEKKGHRTKGKEGKKWSGIEMKSVAWGKAAAGTVVAPEPAKVPGKRGRKPKIKVLPPLPMNEVPRLTQGFLSNLPRQVDGKTPINSMPKQRGRKLRVPNIAPVGKKKGKRKNQMQAVQEGSVSDYTTSKSVLDMGGEDSQEPLDNMKRRSGRQVKRRKYNEDLDFKVVDDDGETIAVLGAGRISALNATALAWQAEEPPEDEANIIEKILSARIVKKESFPSDNRTEEKEEFYVKYRNFSFLHCKWATLEELEKDPRIHQKIKRFRTKQAQMKHLFTEPDEDLFNPDYVEVDRVLEVAVTTDTETGEEVTHYLIKWCSLSYEEATWELQEDLDPEKIKEFEEIQKLPTYLRHTERPPPEKWQKLEHSRDYRGSNQLREYQLEGMNWLLFNWYNRKNCILADEMGLGKTIQSITFLYEIFNMGIHGPFLIIAPLSTITNWEREFRTWTHMNVIVYHGSQISRQMILQYEMFYRDSQGNSIPGVLKFHGMITTFEMIMADCPELKKLHWRCVVIDEAHRLKNRNCKLLEGLKLMNLEHKVLLTGTPLQNSVEELFSLLNFLEPLQFQSENTFLEEFGDLKTDEQVKKLQAILKPMMLRRLKDDVEKNLAPKEETIIEVELTNIQKKYYRAILEKNFSFLSKGANQHNMPNLINTMMELRKCCNHPYLITGAEEKILESFKKSHSADALDFQLQAMIQAAGKLVLIDKLLPKLLAGGHKVLVFSQMVRCLDILEDYLIQRRYTYERIDGRVRGNLRQAAIDRFCKTDSDRFVFLLCTRAGGLGINLTAADTCIIFDSDWNPQNDLQAQARCHRIGQSKAVKVYRLITRNSYEREMFDKASLKLGLDKAILQDINRKGSLNGVQQLSKIEVEDLLKKGAYGALMDEEDEGSKFCEEDIDQILQRRTQTITIQTEGKGSTFAKASFISSGNRTDISLDDPNFWQKWAKIADVEINSKSEKESLVIDTPRVRKQTRHYNSFEDDELMEFSELDSDSEERPCRTRRLGERSRRYLRAECFRVEKNLLIFGWGRWKDILNHGRFKWHLAERDMEVICRALLVYCLRHYKGDDKIKSFIWDLISPSKEGQDQALLNHSGLAAPVPRGRKGKRLKSQLNFPEVKNVDWLVHCNPEAVLQDESYKKHLKQHCNKVLLRVRMLYYLKVEILGDAANQAQEGIPASKLDVSLPDIDYIEVPATWWDAEADKSLLIGVHKHGYERYNAMRADPDLCFLERVGMPDVTALSAEQGGGEGVPEIADSVGKAEGVKDNTGSKADEGEDKYESSTVEEMCFSSNTTDKPDSTCPDTRTSSDSCTQEGTLLTTETTGTGTGVAALHVIQARPLWPAGPTLTARLRRLITAYQRFTLRREPLLRHDFPLQDSFINMGIAGARVPQSHQIRGPLAWQLGEDLRQCSTVGTEPDSLFLEWQNRWTRREEADFYRTVSSFGVVYDTERKIFDWSQFRTLARLERKTDESLERYFNSFVNMCRIACKLPPKKEEGPVDSGVFVEPLTEERAARTLYRIELLRKIREQVLRHPLILARLQLCRPSLYLPVWWEPGKHDRDLLIGAACHGLSRTDFYILNDPQLSFLEAHRNYVRGHPTHRHSQSHPHTHPPGSATHPEIPSALSSSSSSSSSHPQMPNPHCCLYDSGLGHLSPQPPEYPHQMSHHHQHHPVPQLVPCPSSSSSSSHSHHHPPPVDSHIPASPSLEIDPCSRGDFIDCPTLDETLELGSLHGDVMSSDALHGEKATKDALNGFPFNSTAGGQSMLNSYGVGGTDLDSKLRSDVLVGEQGSSEETGLMAPSVELDKLQAPWDSTDHSSPAHHMFNESDPILGPPTGFLEDEDEEAREASRRREEEGTLEECLGLPPSPSSSPSHPSAGHSVEPMSSSYMFFKDIADCEEPSTDQTVLSASPPPPYVPPPTLSLAVISAHEPQDRLVHSDITESLPHSVEERGESAGFEFYDKDEHEAGGLSREMVEHEKLRDHALEGEEVKADQDQSFAILSRPMDVPQMNEVESELGHGEEDEKMDVSNNSFQDLREHFYQAEHKEDLSQDVRPCLGNLEQEHGVVCPVSLSQLEEDYLIFHQTVDEETIKKSLNTETLTGHADEDAQATGIPKNSKNSGQVNLLNPQDDVHEISERQIAPESICSEYTQPCCPGPPVSSPPVTSKSEEKTSENGIQADTQVLIEQDDYSNKAEPLGSLEGSRHCSKRSLSLSPDQDNKDIRLQLNENKMPRILTTKSPDTKTSEFLPDSGCENKPQLMELPIKEEVTKTENPEDSFADNSEVKHGKLFSYDTSEDMVVKAEQFTFHVKQETLETKPECLSLEMKPETLDSKYGALQYAAYSGNTKIKLETKTEALRLTAYADEVKYRPETKPEGPEVKTYPDGSEIKPEADSEGLEFRALAEMKTEPRQELLEVDSTVVTAKLEQANGVVDLLGSLAVKSQIKDKPKKPVVEGYVSRLVAPASLCEMPDNVHDTREPTIAQLLQEKALYSFSEWPKDRVIINRLDSICHAILKGKWPTSSEQYDLLGSVAASSFLAPSLAHQQHRAGFLPTTTSSSVLSQARIQQTNPGLGFPLHIPLTRLPKYMQRGGSCGRGGWRLTTLPLLQERLVAPPCLPELKRAGGRRSFNYETMAASAATNKVFAAKSASSSHTSTTTSSNGDTPMMTLPSHHTGTILINGLQESAIDLTKASTEIITASGTGMGEPGPGVGSDNKLPPTPITAPQPSSVGINMSGILQAGLIHPVTGQIVNGSLRADDSLRRRRGRRRNVEALYSEFTKKRGLQLPETQSTVETVGYCSVSSSTSSLPPSPPEQPAGPPTPSSTSTPTPTQTPPEPELIAIDREATSKGLLEWLKQNQGYSMDLPAFSHSGAGLLHGFVERPKQRRHRCKDPAKLDINSLTGEERVPVVHRGTGRRLGGAMAPAIKELSRWLDTNSEYYVAADWADVVKHSGFLPEGKFSRILTEPINRDPGSRRRGRRPRSEMPKPLISLSNSASSTVSSPLFMNGRLIASMDSMLAMQNLRSGIAGLPISGIMAAGFPHGFSAAIQGPGNSTDDTKNGLSMLPMMLQGIPHTHGAAVPQHTLFTVGPMMTHTSPQPSHHSSTSSSSPSAVKITTTSTPSTTDTTRHLDKMPAEESSASSGSGGGEKEGTLEKNGAVEASKKTAGIGAEAIISSTSRAQLGSAHLGTGTGNHLTFNPFLIPSMSHGLLYPHMFLPHGGIMALPTLPQGTIDCSLGSTKKRRKRGQEEGETEEERLKTLAGQLEEKESTVETSVTSHPDSSSFPPIPSTLSQNTELCPTEEPEIGRGDGKNGSTESHVPYSKNKLKGATNERLDYTDGEAVDEIKQDYKEQTPLG